MSDHHQTRRRFLAQSAAGAAAAAALGSFASTGNARSVRTTASVAARAGVRPPAAGEAVRIAVIGTGGMGTGHVNAFLNFAQKGDASVHVVGLADVCQSHLDRAAKAVAEKQAGVPCQATRNYKELLAREDIHGVLIASPEHWHAQHAIDTLASGKDVYVEKPMTLRLDEAIDLRAAVLAHPERIFQVGTQMMMLPKYREARKLIAEGAIGKPTWSQTSYCRNSKDGEWNYYEIDEKWDPSTNLDWDNWLGKLGPRAWDPKIFARWRRYRDFSTGIIGDLLVHVMTPMVYALGDTVGWPTRVTALGGHYIDKAMENHDQVNLTIQFENDHTMIVAGSTNNEVGLETLIRGHEANLYLGGRNTLLRPERIYVDDVEAQEIELPDIGNDQDQLRLDWLRCIRSREAAQSNIDLASKVMVIVDLATRSMWDGGRGYTFDPITLKAAAV
jgi:predicted dehydrogenase